METVEVVEALKKALGPEGIAFFRKVHEKYGKVDTIWWIGEGKDAIPHPVHFREGMTVRNVLRKITNYEWTDHEYDDRWAALTGKAIEE